MDKIINKFYSEVNFDLSSGCASTKNDCVVCLRDNYFEALEIDYDCENKRKLYVVRYLPVHIKEVKSGLELMSISKREELLNKKTLNVICLGGGPGTDNAAFNKWLVSNRLFEKKAVTKVNIVRVDRCEEWNNISPYIIGHAFPDDITVKYLKVNHDVTKHNLNVGGKIDLVIASYLVSEIALSDIPKVVENLKNIINDKAVIVINDRNQPEVREKISKIFELLDCTPISNYSQLHCDYSFDPEIASKTQPKFNTSSIRYLGEI
ncbi:hypothetical protein [Aliivibrio sifiae]|uniref:SAM-dependent methyltransferase n=1 Tax=Aliivibrio sifiae TaxID=566293 RepID=A0A2S7X2U0_9GAMM|nr:hypothetical protein [Aliivibrio sifiae]PQJ84531.1 hypothetical protein BTO22_13500 [Aliivibrio sifiae]